MSTTTLRYEGGADLSFRDASGAKRKVLRGDVFEVDAETAEILLTDPAVLREDDVPRETSKPASRPKAPKAEKGTPKPGSFAELQARGKLLGLKVVGVKRADLEAAIAAAEKTSTASAPASGPGAITLGDLPKGGIQGGG